MAFNPLQAGQDIVRQSMQSQYQLLQTITGKFLNASMQMAELNREASRKLLEESAADLQKAMNIKSIPDAQAFIGEQTRGSLEKVRGYWTNVQTIAAENFTGKDILPGIDAINPLATAAARSVAASVESVANAATTATNTAANTAKNVADNAAGAASDAARTAASATASAVNTAANTVAANAKEDTADKANETKAGKHAHDVDPAPSPLVEKLIATVTGDTAKSGAQH